MRIRLLTCAAILAAAVLTTTSANAVPLGPDLINAPDTAGDVGQYVSLVLDGNGNPVLSYLGGGDLKVLHCTNPDCSGTQSPQTPDVSGAAYTSIALDGAGNPVVSYVAGGNLTVLHCTNANCSGTQAPQSLGSAFPNSTSLELDAADNPVVSYTDGGNTLRVLHCTNPNCSGVQVAYAPVGSGAWSSLALDDAGNPVVSFTTGTLRILRCTNQNCSGTQTAETPDPGTTFGGAPTSITLDTEGNPVVSYYSAAVPFDLRVLHCSNQTCSGSQTAEAPDDSGDSVGVGTSIALDPAGNPVVSYADQTNGAYKLLHCTNQDCSGPQSPDRPDVDGTGSGFAAVAVDAAGSPVMAYYDASTDDLKVLHCYDPGGCGGLDQDQDGALHGVDNCPADANPTQLDTDSDTDGDACDPDDDNDTVLDTTDNCPVDANPDQADVDGDGSGNLCDDRDNRIPAACGAGFEGANVIIGTRGANTLRGTRGRDVIVAKGGGDTVNGRGGRDCVVAGRGADDVRGGRGADVLLGGRGRDTLSGGRGADTGSGGPGRDTCFSGTYARCENPLG